MKEQERGSADCITELVWRGARGHRLEKNAGFRPNGWDNPLHGMSRPDIAQKKELDHGKCNEHRYEQR
jgi:hypothetical protein